MNIQETLEQLELSHEWQLADPEAKCRYLLEILRDIAFELECRLRTTSANEAETYK
jgi:hypothetical protein